MAFASDKGRQGAAGVSTGYDIDNSLRFNDNDSAYLSRTPSSAGNQKTWTWSGWLKIGKFGTHAALFGKAYGSTPWSQLMFESDKLEFRHYIDGYYGYNITLITTQVFRDPSAWYHIVLAVDTEQGVAANRVKMYVNGEQITDFSTATYPAEDYDTIINSTNEHQIGRQGTLDRYLDGLLSEVHFIDGTALDPTSFGETGDYGEWKAKKVSGLTYGTNGFYLPFSNKGTKHTITANGGITHSTSQNKIGSSSLSCDGSGDYLNTSNSSDFNISSGNWTMEGWFRPSTFNTQNHIGSIYYDNDNHLSLRFHSTHGLVCTWQGTSAYQLELLKSSAIGDWSTGTWYHIAVVVSGTSFKVYVNGTCDTSNFSGTISTYPTSGDYKVEIGDASFSTSLNEFNGYIDEFRVSNTARYTTNFTPSTTAFTDDSNTLLLIHSDTTNGSTTFTDSSGVVGGLGNDANGSNNWTTNNLASTDQMVDTPTNNFCTLNPNTKYVKWLNSSVTDSLSQGNLSYYGSSDMILGSFLIPKTGKWYWETLNGQYTSAGITSIGLPHTASYTNNSIGYYTNAGNVDTVTNSGTTATPYNGAAGSSGELIGYALDMDNSTLKFYRNGSLFTTISSGNFPNGTDDQFIPSMAAASGTTAYVNFGQDSSFAGNKTAQGKQDSNDIGDFYYTPPSGFLALCTKNLPDPAVIPSEHFNTVTWSGDGASSRSHTGMGFQPDLVWTKTRSDASSHMLWDSARGAGYRLHSDQTVAEAEETAEGKLSSFDSDGFSSTTGTTNHWYMNNSGTTYVAWNWKANGAGVSNTDGSITSTVSANVDAGFSIVKYTGTGVQDASVGHGLSKRPDMLIIKERNGSNAWLINHSSMAFTESLFFDTAAKRTGIDYFGDTDMTATVFHTDSGNSNVNATTFIAYCFHSVDGYSKVGSYTGNGQNVPNGVFTYTGFRPAYVMLKRTDSADPWVIFDSAREPENEDDGQDLSLKADSSAAEASYGNIDFLSNGFKVQITSGFMNASGSPYIFLAIAESPFKHTNAR
jgi:hypothetical protein